MDIRLICMDLDGTALQNDHKTFTPRLLNVLEEAHQQGIAIVPVTGRQYQLLPQLLLEHPVWESYVVLANGAQIRKLGTGELLHSLTIPAEALCQLLTLAADFSIPIEFSIDSCLHLTDLSWQRQQGIPNLHFHVHTILKSHGRIVDSLDPLCCQAVEKVNLPHVPEPLHAAVESALKQIDVTAVWSSATSMEITHSDATKGNGLAALSRLTGIPIENIMALGDSGNDETMLRCAGLGVAMGNAPAFVKAAADVTTETNENDGAAIAIETYALNR